ncbi:putative ribosome-binding factor A, mitochondrial isoform X2 [Eulemur rufifrons]|uniref:putative ribosome-binding factor A, mitochondrial isoform X2 n=1 Tax=Eulemur rufifrons TaxID=859984 RepID=UPI003741EBE7
MWAPASGLLGPRAGLRALLCGCDAALLPGRARALHGSAVACGSKNLLKKFASKSRKKFWYEGPSLGSHLTHTPSKLESIVTSTSKKTRKEDHVRLRALNGLLYKALTDLLCTPEVSQEVCDLHLELSKVSLTSDFSACRVYWKTTLSAEQNAHARAVLQRSAAHMRLTSYWQWPTLDPRMESPHQRISGTLRPHRWVTPRNRPRTRVCAGSITRRSASRSWSTSGGERAGSGVRLGQRRRPSWQSSR